MTLAPPLYAELASYFLPRARYLEAIDLDVHKLLHIRSFLDHNRPYVRLASYAAGSRTPQTSGAFAYLGDKIPPDELGDNLVCHLRRWAPYLRATACWCSSSIPCRPS